MTSRGALCLGDSSQISQPSPQFIGRFKHVKNKGSDDLTLLNAGQVKTKIYILGIFRIFLYIFFWEEEPKNSFLYK